MADNKVLYGFSDLYIGTYTEADDGTVTLGTPYHQAGAVGFSPEGSGENYTFYADNIPYFSYYSSGAYEGDITVAMFDDAFKTQFLGQVEVEGGGIAEVKNATKPNVYLAFEVQGDKEARRILFLNGSLGDINREYATIEESVEAQTEVISATFVGDNKTGISKVTYKPGDAGYDTLFTAPTVPVISTDATPGE